MDKKKYFYQVLKTVEEESQEFIDHLRGNPVIAILDVSVLQDCFDQHYVSLKFYNQDNMSDPECIDHLNNYKKAAHLGYWIAKLKPLRLVPKSSAFNFSKKLIFNIGGSISQTLRSKSLRLDKDERAAANFPFNEFIAIKYIRTFLVYHTTELISRDENLTKKQKEIKIRASCELIQDKLEAITRDLTLSFRYHTYSARGTAMLIESVLNQP